MRAYILPQDHSIAPFGEPAREAVIGGERLQDLQQANLRRLGFTVERVAAVQEIRAAAPYLLLREDLFVSPATLRAFVRQARRAGENCRLALPDSLLMQRYQHLQNLERDAAGRFLFDLWWVHAASVEATDLAQAQGIEARFREIPYKVLVPKNIIGRDAVMHPLTATVAMRIRHWVHILWANNLAPQIRMYEAIRSHPLGSLWRLLASLGLSKQAIVHRLIKNFVFKGHNVRIHPTARVEFSILGDDVDIGPFALVRGSLIGSGTIIEDRANIIVSSVAERSFVSRNSTMVLCAGYPDSDLCANGMQSALAGRKVALTSYVRPMDMRVGDAVRVRDGDETVSIPEHLIGPCFGHQVFIGPDVAIQSGRAIPNGAVILPPPGHSLGRVPQDWPAGQIGVIIEGELKPLP